MKKGLKFSKTLLLLFLVISFQKSFAQANEPTDVVATAGLSSASIAFTAPTNVGGGPITNYQYSLDNGSSWVTPSPAVTASPLLIEGLINCTTYSIKIRAVNAVGGGTPSAEVSVTPQNGQESGINWKSRTPAADNTWLSVTYGNGLFVAVAASGTNNRVMTSADGINWTSRTSAADNSWSSVTYGNGLFVAVANSGTGNRVMTSPDGINWTSRTSAADNSWSSVTYGNGLFVAVARTGTGNRVMTSGDGITWTSRTSAANNFWNSVTYGNGLFVAVATDGTGNCVMTSTGGITWTSRTQAADSNWWSVTYGNGLFVAVAASGTGNRVMTSENGIDWTSRTAAADNFWQSVTYGNGLFVAVGDNGSGNRVMTSPNGITWTSRTSAANNSWRSVTYGNGLFVAVATNGTGNRVMTSSDAFAPGVPSINSIATTRVNRAVVSFTAPTNVGYSAISNYEYSIDNGSSWVTRSPASTTSPLTITGLTNGTTYNIQLRAKNSIGVGCASATVSATALVPIVPNEPTGVTATAGVNAAYVNFTAPTNDGGTDIINYEYTLNDGTSWTPIASKASPLLVGNLANCTQSTIKIRAVNSVGGGAASSAVVVTPQNGNYSNITYWKTKTSAAANNWNEVTYGNGLFVAVASSGTGNRVMTSTDGINWTSRTSATDNNWQSVTYVNGVFVAVANSGTGNRVMTSPDGITWTSQTSAADNNWYSVTYGNGLFVAVATSGTGNRVMTSPDGITWTSRTSAADNQWYSVTYGNGLFVAVASSGTGNRVMTSPDGITWTSQTSAANNFWQSVTYSNGLFVAVASSGTGNCVMTSPDGITWTSRTSAADNQWCGVTYANGLFVAVSNSGTGNRVMTSPDGITWTSRSSQGDASFWQSVTYGNGLFVAVSSGGTSERVMTPSEAFAPSVPTINTIATSATQADVSFTAPTDSGYSAISNYEYSINNGSTWVTPSPAVTTSPLTISGLTSGTNYNIQLRAVNGDGVSCATATVSMTTTSSCVNPTSGGTIAAAQSGTSPFNPAAFTSSAAASGETGTLEYKWQSSTTSSSAGFSDIASSNAATYDAGALTVTTWFKRLARVDCSADWTGAAESNVLEVTVTPCVNPTIGGTIAAAQSGTSPFNPAAFTSTVAASGETGTLEYKWQSSITSNSSDFIDIASSNTETYAAGALTQTTWFKRLARVDCSADWTGAAESNVLEVMVTPTASAQTFCGSKTVADLVATGTDLKWYDVAINGNALASTTAIASGTYYVSQTVSGNESDRTSVEVTVTPSTTTGSVTTSACDSYTWPANGVTYTSSQTNLTHTVGCNTATLNVTITPSTTTGSVTTSACASYTWPANGVTYTSSQTNLTHIVGCNTATLNLTITPSTTTGSVTTSACDSYTWAANGLTYTSSQTNLTHIVGCNTATLNLTITPSTTTGSVTTSACASYTWPANGVTYTSSQTNLTHIVGCNTATLNVTITPSTTTGSVTTLACDSYTWPANGVTYTSSQTNLTHIVDCNTATLNLTITPSTTTGSVTTSACDSYTWAANGVTYTSSQTNLTHIVGCNTATLNLTIIAQLQWYLDADSDGYYTGAAISSCVSPGSGYTITVIGGNDCDDANALVWRTASFYVDADADGYSPSASSEILCYGTTTPSGYAVVTLGLDCDDMIAAVNPGHVEVLYNGIDDNCDGQLDEGFQLTTPLQTASCGTTLATIGSLIYANINYTATGYRFKVVNNTTGATQTINRSFHWFALSMLADYQYATTYTISVELQKAGIWLGYYGTTCTVNTPDITSSTGSLQLNPSQCGATLPSIGTVIATTPLSGATGYRFRVTDITPGATGANLIQVKDRSYHWFTLPMLSRFNYGSTYMVEVAVKTTAGYSAYGSACTVITPAAPTLINCGTIVPTAGSLVYTSSLNSVSQYRFQVTKVADLSTVTFDTNKFWFSFRVNVPGYTADTGYLVRVAVMTAGNWSPYGDACEIVSPAAAARIEEVPAFDMQVLAYPNPFSNEFKLNVTTSTEGSVELKVYDMLGKLIETKSINTIDYSSEDLGSAYPAGVYNVIVTQGENVKSLRMIKR